MLIYRPIAKFEFLFVNLKAIILLYNCYFHGTARFNSIHLCSKLYTNHSHQMWSRIVYKELEWWEIPVKISSTARLSFVGPAKPQTFLRSNTFLMAV